MPSWIEPPPKQRKTGCLGKGCMMVVVFLVLLAVAFFIGGYVGVRYVVTSEKPKEISQVESTEEGKGGGGNRWEEFKAAPQSAPVETTVATTTTTTTEPTPAPTPTSKRIELSASDINQ